MKKPAKKVAKVLYKKPRPATGSASRTITLGGVKVVLPKIHGKPKYHTEEEIRTAVRNYFASQK